MPNLLGQIGICGALMLLSWAMGSLLRDLRQERDLEVLELLGCGFSNREIAEALLITEGTAKNHVSNVIEKLGLRDWTQAALWAVRHGIG